MKFHLHVVDGGATSAGAAAPTTTAAAESSAVLLFAHMTLRCAHLVDVVAVSASTTPAAARQAQLLQQAHGAATGHAAAAAAVASGASANVPRTDADVSESEDTKLLQAAGAVLTGAISPDSEEARALPYAPSADGAHAALVPYKYFTTPFAVAEQSLRLAIRSCSDAAATASSTAAPPPPPYFDLVATTDMTTFEYVLDYYQQQRARTGGVATGGDGRGTKPVGVLHIVADDPSRAARVLQRVLEMVLKRSGWTLSTDANAAEGEEAEDVELNSGEDDDGDEEENEEEVLHGAGAAAAESNAAAASAAVVVGGAAGRSGSGDSWVNHMDEAVHLFAQLFGVDVLVALV